MVLRCCGFDKSFGVLAKTTVRWGKTNSSKEGTIELETVENFPHDGGLSYLMMHELPCPRLTANPVFSNDFATYLLDAGFDDIIYGDRFHEEILACFSPAPSLSDHFLYH